MDEFDKFSRWVGVAAFFSFLTSTAMLCFVGWVIVKLMQHFGVI